MPLKALKQSEKSENDISSILLKFSIWVPLNYLFQVLEEEEEQEEEDLVWMPKKLHPFIMSR